MSNKLTFRSGAVSMRYVKLCLDAHSLFAAAAAHQFEINFNIRTTPSMCARSHLNPFIHTEKKPHNQSTQIC